MYSVDFDDEEADITEVEMEAFVLNNAPLTTVRQCRLCGEEVDNITEAIDHAVEKHEYTVKQFVQERRRLG